MLKSLRTIASLNLQAVLDKLVVESEGMKMKNKIFLTACMIFLIAAMTACSNQPEPSSIESSVDTSEILQESITEPETEPIVSSSGVNEDSITVSEPNEEIATKPAITETTITASKVEQKVEPSQNAVQTEITKPSETETHPPKPVEAEETQASQSPTPTESTIQEPPTTTSEPTIVESYDIEAHLSFARSYAQSIGLTLDSTATDCWDNPISANPRLTNVDENIASRLNRYKNTEGFTAVWIWTVQVSDNGYEIYIGYA